MCFMKKPPKPEAPAPAPPPPNEDEVPEPTIGDGYSSVKAANARRMGTGSLKVKRNFNLGTPSQSGLSLK